MIKSRRIRWAGHIVCTGKKRLYDYKTLVGKPEGKRRLVTPRHRWQYNIKMDLRKIGWEGMNWIHLTHDKDQWQALINTVMNLWVQQNAGNFLTR
jgi:hypothetical protein